MQEVINGDYLAASLNLFTLQKRLKAIRSVMKELWDLHNPVDIPDFQKPVNETFDYQLAHISIKRNKKESFMSFPSGH